MNATGYKIIGYTVWHGGKWYLRRNYLGKVHFRRVGLVACLVALTLGGAAVVINKSR